MKRCILHSPKDKTSTHLDNPGLPFPLAVTTPPPELSDMSRDGNEELDDELDIREFDVRRSRELCGELGKESRSQ